MEPVDAIIIGAGPGGSAAAIALAERHRHVVMLDKAVFPRDKCCGDGLTTMALRELELLGVAPTAIPNWHTVSDVRLRAPGGRDVHLTLPAPGIFAATTPRSELDHALVQRAASLGTDVRQGHRVVAVRTTPDHVEVDVQIDERTTTLAAPVAIAADGVYSPTRRLLNPDSADYRGEWHAFRQYVTVTGAAATDLFVWFEPDLLPGYAWSLPLPGGRANVGFGIVRDGRHRVQDMADLWPALLRRPHILRALGEGNTPEGRHTAWPIPASVNRATLAQGRVLFVGDAARAGDVMTGEGIGQALVTGRLAAHTVMHGTADHLAMVARYRSTVHRHLLADHRVAATLNRALTHRRAADLALALVDRSPWTRRHFARWMFEDEPRAALLTPRRWHRRFLKLPGAFVNQEPAA